MGIHYGGVVGDIVGDGGELEDWVVGCLDCIGECGSFVGGCTKCHGHTLSFVSCQWMYWHMCEAARILSRSCKPINNRPSRI